MGSFEGAGGAGGQDGTGGGLLADLDTSGLTPEHARVIEISQEQFRVHGRAGAAVVWTGPARCAAVTYGGRGSMPVTLSVTEDGMAYCRRPPGGVLWCVSLRPPNSCRVKRGALWVSKIDGEGRDARFGRVHPFMAYFNDPGRVALPYAGAWAIYRGHRAARGFKALLRSLGAQLE